MSHLPRILAAALLFLGSVALAADKPSPTSKPMPVYKEFVEGNPNAKLTVIEYASLTCPHCANFFLNSYPELKKTYIDTGKVRFIFRDFPTAPPDLAIAAAALARCAPEGGGKVMLELMFKNQAEWMQAPDKTLRGFAKQAGMKDEDFDLCFKNEKLLDDMLQSVKTAVEKYQVRSTPTFIVGLENGVVVEGEAWEPLKEAIDKALGIINS